MLCLSTWESSAADHFKIGWASVDITPSRPVLMRGKIISKGVKDPVTATVMALDRVSGDQTESVILITCDSINITDGNRHKANMLENVRSMLHSAIPEIRKDQIIMMATHTHVAPAATHDSDYNLFASKKIARAAEQAWQNRKPGGISYGLGHAVIGHGRIATYEDGSSHMTGSFQKGSTGNSKFRHIEGFEDHSLHLLYTWDESKKLTGVVINTVCPAQVQRGSEISADYWHEVRILLKKSLGENVHIFAQLSAAGDIATTVMVEKRGEKRMQKLMFPNDTNDKDRRRKQIAMRISTAVTSVLPYMKNVIEMNPVLAHSMQELDLPGGFPKADPNEPVYPIEIHVVRIGDIAMATNPFELYLDYGVQIKGRSPAVQTFVVELAGSGSYLPTERAVKGGGYGAIEKSCIVGPEAGQEIVETTLKLLRDLWKSRATE